MGGGRRLPVNYHSHEYGGINAPPPLLLWPGYMALPFIRWPLGYYTVSPLMVIWYAFGLFCCQTVVEGWLFKGYVSQYLRAFEIVYLLVALAIWALRWWRQGKPGEPHTAEAGYSWLAWKTRLPVPFTEIILVPGIFGLLGWEVAHVADFEFGVWLMMTAVSLFIMSIWEYRRTASQVRAINDDMVRAGAYGERVGATQEPGAANPGGQRRGESKYDDRDFADFG